MNTIKIYRVYNPKGKFLVEGTVAECAEKLGMTVSSFRDAAGKFREGRYKKYNIYDVTDEERTDIRDSDRDVIKKWDDFVTPIRERFGIPVYKPPKKGR